jgi:hypothetical protein
MTAPVAPRNIRPYETSAASLKTIASVDSPEPRPFARFVRSLTVAKVDSIGWLVRICTRCSVGRLQG